MENHNLQARLLFGENITSFLMSKSQNKALKAKGDYFSLIYGPGQSLANTHSDLHPLESLELTITKQYYISHKFQA